jgi:hypothetical protein
MAGGKRDSEPVDQGRWEPGRVYLQGDTVTDDDVHPAMSADAYPTPGGRFRALVDHYSGVLGPRFLEVDAPGVWQRLETFSRDGGSVAPGA